MKSLQPAPLTSWADEPLILSAERVAQIYGYSVRGLMRRVAAGRFAPPQLSQPARWSRADLEREWREGRRSGGRRSNHLRRSA